MSSWGHQTPQQEQRPNSRKGGGFSLRRSLEEQGLTDEIAIDWHVNFVYDTLAIVPNLDITRYRVGFLIPY